MLKEADDRFYTMGESILIKSIFVYSVSLFEYW